MDASHAAMYGPALGVSRGAPDALGEELVDVDARSSGAVLEIHLDQHAHLLPHKGVHRLHPGHGQPRQPLGTASTDQFLGAERLSSTGACVQQSRCREGLSPPSPRALQLALQARVQVLRQQCDAGYFCKPGQRQLEQTVDTALQAQAACPYCPRKVPAALLEHRWPLGLLSCTSCVSPLGLFVCKQDSGSLQARSVSALGGVCEEALGRQARGSHHGQVPELGRCREAGRHRGHSQALVRGLHLRSELCEAPWVWSLQAPVLPCIVLPCIVVGYRLVHVAFAAAAALTAATLTCGSSRRDEQTWTDLWTWQHTSGRLYR